MCAYVYLTSHIPTIHILCLVAGRLEFIIFFILFQLKKASAGEILEEVSNIPSNREKKPTSAQVKSDKSMKRRCPACGKFRTQLPKHMKLCHNWSSERARFVNMETDQRRHTSRNPRNKGKLRVRCPQAGCQALILCLRDHYRARHPSLLNKKTSNVSTEVARFYTDAEAAGPSSRQLQGRSSPTTTEADDHEDATSDSVAHILSNIAEDLTPLPLFSCNKNAKEELPQALIDMISDFQMWQCGPQGGGNKKITAEQNADMVKRVFVDLGVETLSDALDDSKLWRLFLSKKEEKKWSGQTARSYMNALKKLMSFIIIDARRNKYSTDLERNWAAAISADLPNWSKSYKNQIGIESAKKNIQKLDVLLTPEKINKYKASEEYRQAVKLIGDRAEREFFIGPRDSILVRNFLLFGLNKRNGNRAGVLAELTVEDFNKRQKCWCMETGVAEYIITIVEHKTLASCGPAKLAMDSVLLFQMETYLEHFRYAAEGCKAFFTNLKGLPLSSSSSVAQSLSSHSRAAGLGHMTSNDFRKSATTITRRIDQNMAGTMATAMNHSEAVANRIYNIADKNLAVFESARFLDMAYDGNLKTRSNIVVEKNFESAGEKSESCDTDLESSSIVLGSQPSSSTTEERRSELLEQLHNLSSKRTFSPEDSQSLTKYFRQLMEQGVFLPGSQVDAYVKKKFPEIFRKHNSVIIRNKYRQVKAAFKAGRLT